MITDSFDDRSPAKINVKKNGNAVRVDAAIYTFSHEIEKYVTENYDCSKVGEYKMASGSHSVYVFHYNGKKYGFFKTWVGAPVCIAPIEELTTVLKTDKFIHFGGAGCLNKEIARGKVMIPTEAYRDEGTSYHYAPASDYIRIKNWKTVRDFMDEYKIPIKVRACDTMGYGVNYPGAVIPRSVQGIIYAIHTHAGVPCELIEWHGHNDFYKAVSNSTTAWLYGCCGVNTSLFGIGERTGNTPLEAMVFEYAQLRGTLNGMDTRVITELAEYYEKEIGYEIPPRTPFVGKNFNVTRAGIHADGLLKNEEIYNIFDTEKFLNRPVLCAVSNTSGLAGIAHWINTYYKISEDKHYSKNDELIVELKKWVDEQYDEGRVTVMTDGELIEQIDIMCKKLGVTNPAEL